MRVCVLYAGAGRDSGKLKAIAEALARGVESQGNQVDVYDMALENGKKVSFYDYLIVGTESTAFFGGKIPSTIREFFKNAGTLSGKRCMAFVRKSGLRSQRTLQVLMKVMEGEGMYLRISEVFARPDFAQATGKRLKVSHE
jgi:menaquinone-dependent protoporphyrinogen IX oxidase